MMTAYARLGTSQAPPEFTGRFSFPRRPASILHKALEAAYRRRGCNQAYLAAPRTRTWPSWVRHKVQIAELGHGEPELESGEPGADKGYLREQETQELQHPAALDKNQAKQEVICKLSEKVTQDFMKAPEEGRTGTS